MYRNKLGIEEITSQFTTKQMDRKTSVQTTTATIEDTQAWSSVVVNDTLTLEYVSVDIDTKGIQYHLHLDLANPIPESSLANAEFLTLTWHLEDHPLE